MKQTFEIPEGCTRVTIEQHEDKLVTIFETPIEESFMDKVVSVSANFLDFEFKEDKPEVMFSDGDILYAPYDGQASECIFIFKSTHDEKKYCYAGFICGFDVYFNGYVRGNFRYATKKEKQLLFDALAKVGKKWNADKKCIEELKPERWMAKIYEPYYVLDDFFEVCESEENNDKIDNKRYNAGNYFRTEQQAKDFAEQIKQLPR